MTINDAQALLTGAVDMHVHSSPDVTPRLLSDIELARASQAMGLSAILIKCHHSPTSARAALASEAIADIAVFGGLVLNQPAGGLNPAAVEAELALGAKEVWLPTVSAVNHIRQKGGDMSAAVPVTDAAGRLLPALYDVFDLVAKAGVILGTGHLHPAESERVVEAARRRGVEKILVTHPEWEVTAMPVGVQQRLAANGVFFERCYYAFSSAQRLPVAVIAAQIKAVGAPSTVLSSDLGQACNASPPQGLAEFAAALMASGITTAELELMLRTNPRKLLNIS